jgi:hypothetical protein
VKLSSKLSGPAGEVKPASIAKPAASSYATFIARAGSGLA